MILGPFFEIYPEVIVAPPQFNAYDVYFFTTEIAISLYTLPSIL